MHQDIRWKQRFQNYQKVLSQLTEPIAHIDRIGQIFYQKTQA